MTSASQTLSTASKETSVTLKSDGQDTTSGISVYAEAATHLRSVHLRSDADC